MANRTERKLTGSGGRFVMIGAPLLAHWRVRFDFPRGRLLLAPAG